MQVPAKDQVLDRNELLRSKPEVVGRFMQLVVPVLIDVYAASVITSVRLKTLTGLLKAVGFLETEDLKRVFSVSELPHKPNQILTNSLQVRSGCQFLFFDSIIEGPSYPRFGSSPAR